MTACYERYLNEPPEPVILLNEVTWGELAEKYGNPDNDQVFHFTDITERKWAESYLREH